MKLEKIVALGALFCLTSCATIYIPESKMLRQIENIPFKRYIFDCSDKAVMYHQHLRSKGIKSRIRVGRIEGYINDHAWVEVYNPKTGRWHMIDPTFKRETDGFELKCYPERKVKYTFTGNVTKKDIMKKYEDEFIKRLKEYEENNLEK